MPAAGSEHPRQHDATPRASVARTLAAAGITDPQLQADFERCRQLNAEHGKTYYLATWLLPPDKRPWVWALYGFARSADEFVDSLTDPDPDALVEWAERLEGQLIAGAGFDAPSRAIIATTRRWHIDPAIIRIFLESMRMDIEISRYPTYEDLERYMEGSAAAIGLAMLPVLEPLSHEARDAARELGIAFQLTNFIRDIGEDLDRGRIYLPTEDLDRFGVTSQMLRRCRDQRTITPQVRNVLQYEIFRTRRLYARAERGIELLHPSVRDSIWCARVLYADILREVEAQDYRILHRKAAVPRRRRLAVASAAGVRARRAWRQTEPRRHQRRR